MSLTISSSDLLTDIIVADNDNPFPDATAPRSVRGSDNALRFADRRPDLLEDTEQALVDGLERAMGAIVLAGAALLAAGMLRGVMEGEAAHDAAIGCLVIAIAAGLVAAWSAVRSALTIGRLTRIEPPASILPIDRRETASVPVHRHRAQA